MNLGLRARRRIGWLVAILLAFQSLPIGTAQAGMVATEQIATDEAVDQRGLVGTYVARQEVRDALLRHGIDPDEAAQRIAAMSDGEIAWVAANIEDEPAGQGALGIVVAAGLIALIVLLVADLTGKKDVF